MMKEDLLRAWRANNAINLELLGVCSDEDFELKPGKGKTIRSNYVHMIGVRRGWAEATMRKESATIPKLDWKTASREEVERGLAVSSKVMEKVFVKMIEEPGKNRWTPVNFLAYCVAHEANHRAQVEISLRISGREPDIAVLYELWNWTKKSQA